MGDKVGYARTSTIDQEAGFEAQLRDLNTEGCDIIFKEQVSSVAQRDQLEDAIGYVRKGDTLCVTKLDRLARSTRDLIDIVDRLKAKGVELCIMEPRMDTNGAMGSFMLTIFGAVAQLEREMMLERQREGIAKAKREGKYKGRAPTVRRQLAQIKKLANSGMKKTDIAKELGIGRTSIYRVLAEAS